MKEKKKEDMRTVWHLWDNFNCTSISVIGIPEGEGREQGSEKVFEEKIAENFPNVGKKTFTQVQKVQSPIQDKPKEDHAETHIKQTNKIKYKEKILKTTRENQQITYNVIPIRLSADFSAESLQVRRE